MTGKGSDGPRSPAWRGRAERLGWLIEAATVRPAGLEFQTILQCNRRPQRRRCGAWLGVRRLDIPEEIHWRCPSCGDQGVIHGWRGSAWDFSERAAARRSTETEYAEVRLVEEDHRLLIAQVLDASARGVVMGAEPSGSEVLLEASLVDFERLRECVSRLMGRERSGVRSRRLRRIFESIDEVFGDIAVSAQQLEDLPSASPFGLGLGQGLGQGQGPGRGLAVVPVRPPAADPVARRAVYELRMELCDVKPRIWRRIRVPGDIDLGRLSNVLLCAMGWSNTHLHEFIAGGVRIGDSEVDDFDDFDDIPHVIEERKVKLGDVVSEVGDRLFYVYDLGDDWRHEICVEQVVTDEKCSRLPHCLAGQRACPPEDCGGIPGYEHLLEAVGDRKHPDHIEMLHWIGGSFDAETFSVADVNRRLS